MLRLAGFDFLTWKALFFSRHNIKLEDGDISTGYCFICFFKGNICKCFNKNCFKCGVGSSHFRQQCQAKVRIIMLMGIIATNAFSH